MVTRHPSFRNRLLGSLKAPDLALLLPLFDLVTLKVRQVIETPNKPIEHVYFVESGLASVIAHARRGRRIEVGLSGYEGVTGLSVILGVDQSTNEMLIQGAGSALRISTSALRPAMNASSSLRDMLLRYVQVFMTQTGQTALANGSAKIEERLARWILMSHDRLAGDAMTFTHELLAVMLGVQRSGVTIALHFLESKGLIKSSRSLITIVDREGLRKHANGWYGIPEAEYERTIGRSARPGGATPAPDAT